MASQVPEDLQHTGKEVHSELSQGCNYEIMIGLSLSDFILHLLTGFFSCLFPFKMKADNSAFS